MIYGTTQHNAPARFLSEISGESVQEMNSGFGGSSGFMQSTQGSLNNWASNLNTATQSNNNEPRYVADYDEGDRVEHPLFGRGTVVEVDGDNLAIHFSGKGVKKLNSSFAPIKKL